MAGVGSRFVNEDCIEYFLFPRLSTLKDSKTSKEKLEDLLDSYAAFLSNYLVQYIWQNEPFSLKVGDHCGPDFPPHVYGCTKYGDNIDDEWFIVFLLFELTKSFPDVVIRVVDNDGEFLLIEAADHIPKWMNPETCENRVYLFQGNLHVLPLAQNPAMLTNLPSGTPAVPDAVAAVREYSALTKCEPKIQKAIMKRTGKFPDLIKESHHRAHCYVPAAVAAILKAKPSLLSAAIQAFYLRDPIDLRACRTMKYFPPETRLMCEVMFTKCLYAQLAKQKYIPDKKVGWNLPPSKTADFKSHEIGMKLACGFEILAAGCKVPSSGFCAEMVDLANDVRWNRFVESLAKHGYFQMELEGSKKYKELHDKAYTYYAQNVGSRSERDELPGQQILTLLNTLEVDVEALKMESKNLEPADDDGWLDVTPEHLDELLEETFGSKMDNGNGHVESEKPTSDGSDVAAAITSSLKSFVTHVSSFEGAEFPKSKDAKCKSKGNRVSFDPDAFADAMQSILDFKIPDWDDDTGSSSGMSDYSGEDEGNMDLNEMGKSCQKMNSYMRQMDKELAATDIGKSFERITKEDEDPEANLDEGELMGNLDDFEPVSVDLTALKNILESYSCQQGLPGPASNLLGTMGVQLPQDSDL